MTSQRTVLVGKVLTLDRARAHGGAQAYADAEAIAFEDDRILAVGSRAEVVAAAGPQAEVLDRGARTIAPGFIDAHHHLSVAALYGGVVRLEPPRVTDIPTLQQALREAARNMPPGGMLVASQWDEARLRERRPPSREELDEATEGRPAFLLHYSCHRALANSRALELAGIDARTADPPGGVISRGPGGIPDGLLIEQGMSRVEALARADRARADQEGILARMASHYGDLLRVGITRICDAAVPPELVGLYRTLAARGQVAMPTHICPVSMGGWLEPPLDILGGPGTGEREGLLVFGPVKLVFDGAPGCSMCLSWAQTLTSMVRSLRLAARQRNFDAFRTISSLSPRYGAKVRTGIAIYAPEQARAVVVEVLERGFSVATHALGNAAIDVALDAYESAGRHLHRHGIPRIEHAALATAAQARRIAALGVAAVVQPAMLTMSVMNSAASIPGLPFMPLARLRDAGVTLVGSSDYPVHSFDPLVAIRAAVRRENALGVSMDPEERIDLETALTMYTRNAAEVLGCAHEAGTLTVGKRADIVELDGLEDGALQLAGVWTGGVAAPA